MKALDDLPLGDEPALLARLHDGDSDARPERVILFHIEAGDVNCPQHIKPRFTEEEVMELVQPLKERVAELEAALERKESGHVS